MLELVVSVDKNYANSVLGKLLSDMDGCGTDCRDQWRLIQKALENETPSMRLGDCTVGQAYVYVLAVAVQQANRMRDHTIAVYLSKKVSEDIGSLTGLLHRKARMVKLSERQMLHGIASTCCELIRTLGGCFDPDTS